MNERKRNGGVRRTAIATAAALAMSFLAPACHRGRGSKTLEITLVTKALDSEWWQRVKAGAEEQARAHPDVRLAVLAPEREIDIDQQVAILEDQITRHVSALAVAPTGAAEILPVLNKARAAGIPVVIVDTDVNWPPKLSYVGGDNVRAGRLAGEYIEKIIGGKGEVAVIRGILGVATHEDRLAGFREAIAKAPGIHCVAVQPANSERALGMSVMENLLTRYPELRAVFATNDQMALGAVEAIAAHNLSGKVAVVGMDATWEAVRAVEKGKLAGDIAMHPEALGRDSVEAAYKAATHQPLQKTIDTGETLVTKENAARFLK
jgi:ribose transport system substrate-binding protein